MIPISATAQGIDTLRRLVQPATITLPESKSPIGDIATWGLVLFAAISFGLEMYRARQRRLERIADRKERDRERGEERIERDHEQRLDVVQRATEREVAEEERRLAERLAAEHRVSFLAYEVVRMIMSWRRESDEPMENIPAWALTLGANHGQHFDEALKRIDEISRLTPLLGDEKRDAANHAIVLFLTATNRINQYVASGASVEGTLASAGAKSEFYDLVEVLDKGLISKELLEIDADVRLRRLNRLERMGLPLGERAALTGDR